MKLMVDSLPLPSDLPSDQAMKSWGEGKSSYDPEFWEFQYRINRYLCRVDDDQIVARYANIVRNMRSIISDDRNIIPIFSFLSSWYWYRKEFQTRLEFAQRNMPLRQDTPTIGKRDLNAAPARPRSPNASNVLFRYGDHRWLEEFINFGRVRIAAAREYAAMEKDIARQDDEMVKHSHSPGQYVTITLPDGKTASLIGDLKHSVSGADYFIHCASCDWDPDLFSDFGADCCVVIKNPDEFTRRLEAAAKAQLDGWYFHHCPVEYFDPHERLPKQRIDNAMSKDFRFAYQREYRILWASFHGLSAEGFKFLELGPLGDIAELHSKP